jgi:hypothetical protein
MSVVEQSLRRFDDRVEAGRELKSVVSIIW